MTPKIIVLALAGLGATGGITATVVQQSVDHKTKEEERPKIVPQPPQEVKYEFEFPKEGSLTLVCPENSYPDNSLDYQGKKDLIIVCSRGNSYQGNLVWSGSFNQNNTKQVKCWATGAIVGSFKCESQRNSEFEAKEIQLERWQSHYVSGNAIRIT
ncbi:hypothetical protein MHLP_01265 [Candidatus Mycoplasma haematolamae str. Purdue]|uniref:Uncharacterized protein n=1 Tax=Mycoplasma haematolamae (strain Purdue) TaxID=1212765 RepID=I7BJ22_MYCHA|nr:hypothetical protein [Candidatus Mycoplasma haematolamae]AFO51833.1 hypothetical protein MHLP_01265 [Candidatus Mycoplasma haematolamae str. Purdue]